VGQLTHFLKKGFDMQVRLEARKAKQQLREAMYARMRGVQAAMAEHLQAVRIEAVNHIIPNKTKELTGKMVYNSRRASLIQPSTPGKLTHRTMKLRLSLLEKTKVNMYQGFSYGRTKSVVELKTAQTNIRVQTSLSKATKKHTVLGTITASPNYMLPSSLNRFGGMKKETPFTMHARDLWETGIGGEKRPFIAPAHQAVIGKFIRKITDNLDTLNRG